MVPEPIKPRRGPVEVLNLDSYVTKLHGQDVTIKVLPPGDAIGSRFRPNIKCKTYKYGGFKPKKRKWKRRRQPQEA